MKRTVDPAAFGALLAALWAAHDLADHVVQTDHQAANKASSWRAMSGHVGSYTAVQLLALAALRGLADVRPSWRRTLVGVALSASTHALLDRRWPVAAILRATSSPGFATSTIVRVEWEANGHGLPHSAGIPRNVPATGPLPLHGPYLADQAFHHGVLAMCAAILARP